MKTHKQFFHAIACTTKETLQKVFKIKKKRLLFIIRQKSGSS